MRRSYRFLLRPTVRQRAALSACLEDHRQLYNAALEHRRTAWRMAAITVRYGDQSAELKEIRREDPAGQGRWSFSSQQATIRRLDKAMAAFFRRVRGGQAPATLGSRAGVGSTRSPGPPTGRGTPTRLVKRPPASSTITWMAATSHSETSGSAASGRRGVAYPSRAVLGQKPNSSAARSTWSMTCSAPSPATVRDSTSPESRMRRSRPWQIPSIARYNAPSRSVS
jgi:Helix-turn-helix domain